GGSTAAAAGSDPSANVVAALDEFPSTSGPSGLGAKAHTPKETLTDAEKALLARLPQEEQSACVPKSFGGGELAAFECVAPNGVQVVYIQFSGPQSADHVYSGTLKDAGISRDSGVDRCPNGVPSEQPWSKNDAALGRLVCFTDSKSGGPVM